MRNWISVFVLGVAIGFASILTAQTADEKAVAGRWEGQRAAEGRLDNFALVFDVTAKGMTGTVFYRGEDFGKMDQITIKGSTVTFANAGMTFTGVIDDTHKSMTLTAHFDNRDLWSMTLTKKEKS
jgi:hypothetical protein